MNTPHLNPRLINMQIKCYDKITVTLYCLGILVLFCAQGCIQRVEVASAASSQIQPTNAYQSDLQVAYEKSIVKLKIRLNPGKLKETFSIGSGIVWNSDGIVVTCCHLFDQARSKNKPFEIFANGKKSSATLLHCAPKKDIAILRIKQIKAAPLDILPVVKSPSAPQLGRPILCVGFPRNDFVTDDLPTITSGVIGAVNRKLKSGKTTVGPFFQTDAYAGTGNSGGGVFNQDGELVGMVVKILQKKGQLWDGATYAIPVQQFHDHVSSVLNKL